LDGLERGDISFPADLQEVGVLTPYAVEARYPGYWGEISRSDVAEAIDLAERTVRWAEALIQVK